MGYTRQTALEDTYIADSKEDLALLPRSSMGSICWVISEGKEYICNSKGKWLPKVNKITDINPTNYYTKSEIDNKISETKISLTENEVLAITLTQNL